MIISDEVSGRIDDAGVEVFFIPRECSKWWNAQRGEGSGVIALLGGWYWCHGREEAGPFRTKSGALRDAFYRRVTHSRPPLMDKIQMDRAVAELTKPAKRQRRPANGRTFHASSP